jgi:peroxiredoxin (alkyl hydroperoxide reductase subunit C)
MQFLYAGLKAGENAVYVTISEKPKDIIDDAKSFGWDLTEYIGSNKLYILDMNSYTTIDVGKGEALNIRRMMADLTDYIHKVSAKRVAIESIDYIALNAAESEANAEEYLREMALSATNLGCTILFTSVLPSTARELSIYSMAERVMEGVIVLDIDEKNNKRLLSIRKMRKTGVSLSKYEYSISAGTGILIEQIKKEGRTVRVGKKAPEFLIEAYYNNESVRLSSLDYRGKWLVLVFYPGDFTFVCPTELYGIAERYEAFKSLGAEVISISMNTTASHKTWRETSPQIATIRYPMGSDQDGEICSAFGVLTEEGTTSRATFIIDPEGNVVAEEINEDSVGRSTEELLRKLAAAKYVKEHPNEVCPEGWKSGEPALKT